MPTPTPKLGIPKPVLADNVTLTNFNTIYDAIDAAAQKEIGKASSAPTTPATNDLWVDTTTTPNVLKRWDGAAWVIIGTAIPNTFSRVKAGATTVAASQSGDIVELVAGSNIVLTPDAVNKKITIDVTMPALNFLPITGGTTTGLVTTSGGLVLETRTTDPASPAVGRIWFRTDL